MSCVEYFGNTLVSHFDGCVSLRWAWLNGGSLKGAVIAVVRHYESKNTLESVEYLTVGYACHNGWPRLHVPYLHLFNICLFLFFLSLHCRFS